MWCDVGKRSLNIFRQVYTRDNEVTMHDVLISNAFDVCHLIPGCTVLVDTPAPDHV